MSTTVAIRELVFSRDQARRDQDKHRLQMIHVAIIEHSISEQQPLMMNFRAQDEQLGKAIVEGAIIR
jgi:hypothetical protein